MSFEKIMLYGFGGFFFLFLVISSKILPALGQIPRIYAWRKFAKDAGLTFVAGSFFNEVNAPAPMIVGTYRNHSIQITADTFGKIGFFDSFTQINVSLYNRATLSLPQGGLLAVRRVNLRDFLDRHQKSATSPALFSSHRIYAMPENLGNFINRNPSFQKIVTNRRFSELTVKGQNLYYRHKNVDINPQKMQLLLNNIVDIADAFEEYSKAWIK